MIHLAGPVVLAAALAGAGAYGLLARRNAVLVLIGAELMLNAVNVLLVTAGSLPATGLAGLRAASSPAGAGAPAGAGVAAATEIDPLLPGPVLAIMVVTIAAAEIGLALAIVLLAFRQRATSDLTAMRELGETSPTYEAAADQGELPPDAPAPPGSSGSAGPASPQTAPAGASATGAAR